MTNRVPLTLFGALIPLLATAGGNRDAAGTLDARFGTGGSVLTDFGGASDFASAVALQKNGKIIAVGSSFGGDSADFALARYRRDGRLDTTFGAGGKVLMDVGGFDQALGVALQQDGKIVAAGSSEQVGRADVALARFNRDGSLDATFGVGGVVRTDLGDFDQAAAIAIQEDGKIVVAGHSDTDFALVRYDRHGAADGTFGVGGIVRVDFGGLDLAAAVAIQGDGKIVMAGVSNAGGSFQFALARCDPGGGLDTTFGTGGLVLTDAGGFSGASGVAVQRNGTIVAAGSSEREGSSDFTLVRYRADGTVDTSFGTDGKVVTDVGGDDGATGLVIQDDGRIVVAGSSIADPPFGPGRFAVARYDSGGSLDASFGTDGTVLTNLGGSTGSAQAIVLQRDGKIVAAGISDAAGSFDFALVRYTGDRGITGHDEEDD